MRSRALPRSNAFLAACSVVLPLAASIRHGALRRGPRLLGERPTSLNESLNAPAWWEGTPRNESAKVGSEHAPNWAESESSEATYSIKNEYGACLEAPRANVMGTMIHMWLCAGSEHHQVWVYDADTHQIRNVHGICLDAKDPHRDGGIILMWPCNSTSREQKWDYNETTRHIKNVFGKCMDAANRTGDSALVQLWQCEDDSPGQRWDIVQAHAEVAEVPEPTTPQVPQALHGEIHGSKTSVNSSSVEAPLDDEVDPWVATPGAEGAVPREAPEHVEEQTEAAAADAADAQPETQPEPQPGESPPEEPDEEGDAPPPDAEESDASTTHAAVSYVPPKTVRRREATENKVVDVVPDGRSDEENSHALPFTAENSVAYNIIAPVAFRHFRFITKKLRNPASKSAYAVQISELMLHTKTEKLNYKTTKVIATNPGGKSPDVEPAQAAVDGNRFTKWLDRNVQALELEFREAVSVTHFSFITANDFPERDPVQWLLMGSNDSTHWYDLNDQVDDAEVTMQRNAPNTIWFPLKIGRPRRPKEE